MILLLIKSLIIGGLCGCAVSALAARMFFAPKIMSAGSFRTMGEMNACMGDPISHISFGLSYFLSCWANNVAYGGMFQDYLHRAVPNISAGLLLMKNKNVEETVYDPFKMACAGLVVGGIGYAIMNCTGSLVPVFVTDKMMEVFAPVATYLLIVMQLLYLIACLNNGKQTGIWGIMLGAISYLATGNACAGLILGILTGKTIEDQGYKSKVSITFIVLMAVIWGYICYARGFWGKAAEAFLQVSQLLAR